MCTLGLGPENVGKFYKFCETVAQNPFIFELNEHGRTGLFFFKYSHLMTLTPFLDRFELDELDDYIIFSLDIIVHELFTFFS